jgi:hypothetical protein
MICRSTFSHAEDQPEGACMSAIDSFYDTIFNEEEDARVCTDIPEAACTNVPTNFARILASSTASSLADELANGKTVLPWLMAAIGASPVWTGLIVPIRESISLAPQLFIAGALRKQPRRKYAWVTGAFIQAAALLGIATIGFLLRRPSAGPLVIALLLVFSLARGVTSVSSKDVIGKTIPKKRRGRLTGVKAALAGAITLGIGLGVTGLTREGASPGAIASLIVGAAGLWLIAGTTFLTVREEPGATEGGGNAITEAVRRLSILTTDKPFRRFVLTRALFVSTALAGPYYVLLANDYSGERSMLGVFMIASGLAAALSSVIWGAFSDRSSRGVLGVAAGSASALGILMFVADLTGLLPAFPWVAPAGFFLLSIAHAGVRIGRKTYVLDLAGGQKRTDYVAVGNTVIGAVLLVGSLVGALAGVIGSSGILLVLGILGLIGVGLSRALPEVE